MLRDGEWSSAEIDRFVGSTPQCVQLAWAAEIDRRFRVHYLFVFRQASLGKLTDNLGSPRVGTLVGPCFAPLRITLDHRKARRANVEAPY